MIFTIIPAKPFPEAKTRLKPILSAQQRTIINQILLRQTIKTACTVSSVVVISRSPKVRHIAKNCGASTLIEVETGLNAAVKQALQWVSTKGAKAALILPIDLPILTKVDLQTLIALGLQTNPNMLIAPCRQNEGTNALFLHPPDLISPQFGLNSFQTHLAMAEAMNISHQIYRSSGLALDLDTPQDWQYLFKQKQSPKADLLLSSVTPPQKN